MKYWPTQSVDCYCQYIVLCRCPALEKTLAVRFIRHRNETWAACLRRTGETCRFGPTVARTGPPVARRLTLPGDRRLESTPPKKLRPKIIPAAWRSVKLLRGQEGPHTADTRCIFRRRGLARARAAPRERIGDAGRSGRGGGDPRRRSRARRPSVAGEVRECFFFMLFKMSRRTSIGTFYKGVNILIPGTVPGTGQESINRLRTERERHNLTLVQLLCTLYSALTSTYVRSIAVVAVYTCTRYSTNSHSRQRCSSFAAFAPPKTKTHHVIFLPLFVVSSCCLCQSCAPSHFFVHTW